MAKRKRKSDAAKFFKESAEREEKMRKGGYYYKLPEGVERFEIQEGTQLMDIVPYEITTNKHYEERPKGLLWYRSVFFVHFGVGPENKAYLCPRMTKHINKPCPICEEYQRLENDPSVPQKEYAGIKAKKRMMCNVLVDGEVQIFEVSPFNFYNILHEEIKENDEYGYFHDLEAGYTLKVRWKKESFNTTNYLKASRIDFVEREEIDEKILKKVVDLDDCLVETSYKEMQEVFFGIETYDEDDDGKSEKDKDLDQEDETPKRPARKKKDQDPELEDDPEPEAKDEDWEEGEDNAAGAEPEFEIGQLIKISDDGGNCAGRITDIDMAEEELSVDVGEESFLVHMGDCAVLGEDCDLCVACGGSAENSKGKECTACGGDGFTKKEKPIRRRRT